MMSVLRENMFNLFMQHLPGISFIKDLAGHYLYVNDQWKRLVSPDPAETQPGGADGNACARQFEENDQRAIAEAVGIQTVETVQAEDGAHHWIMSEFPIRDEQGEVVLLGGIGFDITRRLRLEEELNIYRERLASLAVEFAVAEDRERSRIAGELHDQVGQNLFLAGLKLGSLRSASLAEDDRRVLEEIRQLVSGALQDIRSLTCQLRPPLLAHGGLVAALCWLGEQFREDFGLQVEVFDDQQEKPLSHEVSSTVFQVVRELLLNIAKHASAPRAAISVTTESGAITITVEDGGAGFDVTSVSRNCGKSGGFGLFNARQKIEYLGGVLTVHSEPGRGTRTVIRLPLRGEGGSTTLGAQRGAP